jgi:hypothetical protein
MFNILGAIAGLVIVHELGHIVTTKILTGELLHMRLTYTWHIPTGAKWSMPANISRWRRIAIALSGFVAEFIFVVVAVPQWWWLAGLDLVMYRLRHRDGGDFKEINFR